MTLSINLFDNSQTKYADWRQNQFIEDTVDKYLEEKLEKLKCLFADLQKGEML